MPCDDFSCCPFRCVVVVAAAAAAARVCQIKLLSYSMCAAAAVFLQHGVKINFNSNGHCPLLLFTLTNAVSNPPLPQSRANPLIWMKKQTQRGKLGLVVDCRCRCHPFIITTTTTNERKPPLPWLMLLFGRILPPPPDSSL